MGRLPTYTWLAAAATLLVLYTPSALASSIVVLGTAGDPNTLNSLPGGQTPVVDAGFFAGGTVLQITATGIQNSNTSTNYFTDANGALTQPTNLFAYANVGATGYPTLAGGDGTNHYAGGGTNYNTGAALFAFAGAASTDTTNSGTIRFGALVGTFSATPVENKDWFLIGTSDLLTIPSGGRELFLAVNDDPGKSFNNGGQFNVTLNSVPEPSSLGALALGLVAPCLLPRKGE